MINKNNARIITISEMAPHIHNFNNNENKVDKIFLWLKNWLEQSIKTNQIKYGDKLPLKEDLAFHIGVSTGTIQNVYRRLEDYGLVESKQRIGTFVINKNNNKKNPKMTSKKDSAIETLKIFIKNNYQQGEKLFSTRKLAKILEISNTIIQLALQNLTYENILEKKNKYYYVKKTNYEVKQIENKTLAEKTAEKIEKYIKSTNNKEKKIKSHKEFSKMYNVSLKTIHDALKILSKKGLIYSRRGRYGTTLTNENKLPKPYFYEEIENKIKHYIAKNCNIGDKLPTIENLSKTFKVSTKTIKRALDNLSDDGYITFTRGRSGGTFVTDIPTMNKENYKWLAISSEYKLN